jgi:hypothetical protein
VATWSAFFYLQTGYVGLSRTSDFNLLGKAIQYGYLHQHYLNPPGIVQRAQEIYLQMERNQDPYSVINRPGSERLDSMANLRTINSYFLAGRSVDFVIKTGQLLPIVLNKQSPFYYGRPNRPYRHPWLQRIIQGFDVLNTLNGKAMVCAAGLALYLFFKTGESRS